MTTGELNLAWAREIVGTLADQGIAEVELAPGSRSTPLVLALHGHPGITVRVHLDERSAGFFALGYGRSTGRPAAVVTTSGTAVANLLPAVVEADASDVPLVVVSADRPPRLRGADANQTIRQVGIFGPRLRYEVDLPVPEVDGLDGVGPVLAHAVARAAGPPGGPVHVNVPFEKPLQPGAAHLPAGTAPNPAVVAAPRSLPDVDPDAAALVDRRLGACRRPIVVAGPSTDPDADGAALADLARRLGIPTLADPLSGARFSASHRGPILGGYDHFLRVKGIVETLAPDLVIRTGRSPTSGPLEAAVASWSDAMQIVIDSGSGRKDHQGLARHYVRHPPSVVLGQLQGGELEPGWAERWMAIEEATWDEVEKGRDDPDNEGALAAAVLTALPPGATLFVSSSMPVRDVDAYGRPGPLDVRVFGNRGASGIDGIVSSVLGCAAGSAGPVVGLVGDLAFYHDMNGLLAARDPDLATVFVVVDNDGGGIFHMLPIRAFEPAFTPYFATPHGLDFEHAARLYALPFQDVATPGELTNAVMSGVEAPGTRIIRIRTDRETNRRRHEDVRERVRRRLEMTLEKERQ